MAAAAATTGELRVELDAEGHVLVFAPGCEAVTGWTEDDVAGRRYWDFLVIDEQIEMVRAAFRAAVSGGPQDAPVVSRHGLRGRGAVVVVDWELAARRGTSGSGAGSGPGGIVTSVVLTGRPAAT